MPRIIAIIALVVCTCAVPPLIAADADSGSPRRKDPTPQQQWKTASETARMSQTVKSRSGKLAVAGAAATVAAASFWEEHPVWTALFALLAVAMAGSVISDWLKKTPAAGDSAPGPVAPVSATAPIATVDPTILAPPAPAVPALTFGAMLRRDLRSVAIKIAGFIGIVVAVFGGMWLLVVLVR